MLRENEVEFDFIYNDLFAYGKELALKMNVPFKDGEVLFPEKIADGYIKLFKINDFISYKVADFTAKTRIVFNRFPTKENHILIVFRNYSIINVDNQEKPLRKIVLNNNYLGSIQCKSTQTSEILTLEPGQELNLILILLKEGWQQSTLHNSGIREKIAQYFSKQNANLNLSKEFLSPDQNKLFKSLFIKNDCFLSPKLHCDRLVINLLESFLKEVLTKKDKKVPYLFASFEDIRMLQKSEQYINENLTKPFPGVVVLSQKSCMSRTKFINLFQRVYGLSSFEYWQKKRLNIAIEYLKSGKHTVLETAHIIGYSSTNTNNFALAFKKEFGLFPNELLELHKENISVKMPMLESIDEVYKFVNYAI